jgi:hypothetical protein
MDVAEDYIVRDEERSRARQRARAELALLAEIGNATADQRAKCAAILKLMNGATEAEIRDTLVNETKEKMETATATCPEATRGEYRE